jgi:hypothetical protein
MTYVNDVTADVSVVRSGPMQLPQPRGPLGAALLDVLQAPPDGSATSARSELVRTATNAVEHARDILTDDDVQLALFTMYELHYRGLRDVDDWWEWDPDLLRARTVLEAAMERALRARVPQTQDLPTDRHEMAETLFAMTAPSPGPSVARFVAKRATREQLIEFLIHRSAYQLKEADPHTWAIPRLEGGAKAALVEIQADEYGGGAPTRMHAALFAQTMRGTGLDPTFGRYVDRVPAVTLAGVNAMSLLGLHRRLRGAIAGHLAAFEMTSSLPNRLYGDGFRRFRYGRATTAYFDEHVEADAVHEQIAGRDLAGGLAEQEPHLVGDILFGAATCLYLYDVFGEHVLGAWERGESSLREA